MGFKTDTFDGMVGFTVVETTDDDAILGNRVTAPVTVPLHASSTLFFFGSGSRFMVHPHTPSFPPLFPLFSGCLALLVRLSCAQL